MMRQVRQLRQLIEGSDEEVYVRNDLGLARMIALADTNISASDSPNVAAGKAIQHLRVLLQRRALLAKAVQWVRHAGRARQTVRALRKKVERGS